MDGLTEVVNRTSIRKQGVVSSGQPPAGAGIYSSKKRFFAVVP